ncbi:MAG: primosomal protein N' [Nitrospirales bacterium]
MPAMNDSNARSAFADVLVPRHLNRPFTYRVPNHLQDRLQVGSVVRIPFGPSTVQGVVVSLSTAAATSALAPGLAMGRLREVLSVQEGANGPSIDADLLDLARSVSAHYLTPLGQCLRFMLPPDPLPKPPVAYVLTESGRTMHQGSQRLAQRTREVLDRLAARPKGLTSSTLQRAVAGPVARTLQHMRRKGWVERRAELQPASGRQPHTKDPAPFGSESLPPAAGAPPPEAVPVVPPEWSARLCEALDENQASTLIIRAPAPLRLSALLQATQEALRRRRTALLITGEITCALNLAQAARARWGRDVELFHSGLSPRARREVWRRILGGEVKVVVGTRSAIFAPLRRLGVLAVEREEEASLKEEQEPRYHAREVAWMRARQQRALLVLASGHPSVETIHAMGSGAASLNLPEGSAGPPHLHVVDLRRNAYGTLLSRQMVEGIRDAVRRRAGVVLYHNRKGFAPLLICRDCGEAPTCRACSVALTYYRGAGQLGCRYCGTAGPLPDACPSCLATRLEPLGFGTERLEEEVRRLFPEARIGRLDRDHLRLAADIGRVHRQVWAGEIDILIGTQMLFRGAALPSVEFVGVPLAEVGLHMPDFRAAERTYHALVEATSLACSAEAGGQAVIQTFLPEHHAIASVADADASRFYDAELGFRRALAYPPFTTLIGLRVSGRHAANVRQAAQECVDLLTGFAARLAGAGGSSEGARESSGRANAGPGDGAEFQILGPVPAFVHRIRGQHRWQIMVKALRGEVAREALRTVLERLEAKKGWRDVKFDVDVDPIEA